MSEWPSTTYPTGPTICPWSEESLGGALSGFNTPLIAIASATWPNVANLAILVPLRLRQTVLVTALWAANGGSAAGNLDVGIYSDDFTRLVSAGGAAQSGTTTIQVFDITDILLGPGLFYMAISKDTGATGTFLRGNISSAVYAPATGLLQATSAYVLPATITPGAFAQSYVPMFGLVIGRGGVI